MQRPSGASASADIIPGGRSSCRAGRATLTLSPITMALGSSVFKTSAVSVMRHLGDSKVVSDAAG
jgi:hypothetical protein